MEGNKERQSIFPACFHVLKYDKSGWGRPAPTPDCGAQFKRTERIITVDLDHVMNFFFLNQTV